MTIDGELVLRLLLSALAALGGAWLGARVALARYRSERSFDRRLEWIERAHQATKRAYDATAALAAEFNKAAPSPPTAVFHRSKEAVSELTEVLSLAELYGSDKLVSDLQPVYEHYRLRIRGGVSSPSFNGQLAALKAIGKVLVNHGRRHLGS